MIKSIRAATGQQNTGAPQLQAGWLQVQNADLQVGGVFRRRTSDELLTSDISSGGTLESPQAAWHREDERLVVARDRLYSYDRCADEWRERGPWTQARLREVVLLGEGMWKSDVQRLGKCYIAVATSEDPSGGTFSNYYAVIGEGGSVLTPRTQIGATGGDAIIAVAADTFVLLLWREATTLYLQRWTPAGGLQGVPSVAGTLVAGRYCYDARRREGADSVVYAYASTSTTIDWVEVESGSTSSGGSITTGTMTDTIAVAPDPGSVLDTIRVAWAESNAVASRRSGGGAIQSIALGSDDARRMTLVSLSTVASPKDSAHLVFDDNSLESGLAGDVRLYFVSDTSVGLVRTYRASTLIGHAVRVVHDRTVWQMASLQSLYGGFRSQLGTRHAIVSDAGEFIARAFPDRGLWFPDLHAYRQIFHPIYDANTVGYGCDIPQYRGRDGGGLDDAIYGVGVMEADHTARPQRPAVLDRIAHCAHGGYPRLYDGESAAEADWHTAAAILSATPTTGGSLAVSSTYGVAMTWEWYDRTGRLYRSAPQFRVVNTGGADNQIDIQFYPLDWTEKVGVQAVFWRTVADGTVYYREGDTDAVAVGAHPATFSLTRSDADVTAYTETLDAASIGAAAPDVTQITDFLAVAQGRLWSRDPQRGYLVRHSYPRREGFGIGWSPLQGVELGDQLEATAVGELDGQIFAFTAGAVHWMAGAGPAATGVGPAFSTPQLIPLGVGAISQEVVTRSENGIVYGSARGPRMLSRVRAGADIMAQVEARYEDAGQPISAIEYDRVTGEVWLGSDAAEGTGLLTFRLHEESGRWAEDSGRQLRDVSASASGELMWLGVDDSLRVVSRSSYSEASYNLVARTPWVRVSDSHLNPSASVDYLLLTGRYRDAHTVEVRIYVNYHDAVAEALRFTPDGLSQYQLAQFGLALSQTVAAVSVQVTFVGSGQCADLVALDLRLADSGGKPLMLEAGKITAVSI